MAAEWSSVKLFPMMKRIVTKLNCFVFFGEELRKYRAWYLVLSHTNRCFSE